MLIEWFRRHQNIVVPFGLLLASFLLLSLQSYRTMKMSWFSRAILSIVGTGQSTVTSTSNGLSDFWYSYIWLKGVEAENRALKKDIEERDRQLAILREQREENLRLRKLLNFKPKGEIKHPIAAEVIGTDLLALNKSITIDKGSSDGIKPRMAVITYDSLLVGQILDEPGSAIGYDTSQVLLITDRRSQVPVRVQRSREVGYLSGRPEQDDCIMLIIKKSGDVRVGDELITSGLGGVFLKGWPIGQVADVVNDPSRQSPDITVKPTADFFKLEEVLVISWE